ncbi:hypothetical protein BP5796_04497 [Coleophoma crateriformis]|uniref:Luciferase-like domain-containing protein n=1 Tax=Coleophoma crateriformis TaxID=565419 RepID=A0A3D8S9G7_9HELO|nr:hypothetical protein BP5796_04497 [Coleophoma crateriformis]
MSNINGHDVGGTPTGQQTAAPKKITLNSFDMSGTLGHLSPGKWKNPKDRSRTKLKLSYWTELAKLLERGNIKALFLADSTAGHAVNGGSLDECIRRGAQYPVIDPSTPITVMAAVTKHLAWKKGAFKTIGLPAIIDHDKRYDMADDYLKALYKLWEALGQTML